MNTKWPLIVAHRGSSAHLPENTLEAFRLALEYRADMLEFDVRTTRDGVPIIFHDPHLQRTTDGKGPVSKWSFEQLRTLDAGFKFDPEGNETFPCRGQGIRIPTLEETITAFPNGALWIEIKEKSEELTHTVVALLAKHHASDNSAIGSKHDIVSKTLQKHYPDKYRFFSRQDVIFTLIEMHLGKRTVWQQPKTIVSVPLVYFGIRFDTARWIQHLHRKQALAFFWTGRDRSSLESLTLKGADGFVTDDPAFTREVLDRMSGIAPTNG